MQYLVVLFPYRRAVLINGKSMGETNMLLELECGVYEVTLGPPQDFIPAQQLIDLQNTSALSPMQIEFQEVDLSGPELTWTDKELKQDVGKSPVTKEQEAPPPPQPCPGAPPKMKRGSRLIGLFKGMFKTKIYYNEKKAEIPLEIEIGPPSEESESIGEQMPLPPSEESESVCGQMPLPSKESESESVAKQMAPPSRYADLVFYLEENGQLGSLVPPESPLRVADWYLLEVAVRGQPVGISPEEERVPLREPKQKQDVTIMVALEGEDFEITEQVQSLILPPLGDSRTNAWFRLKPLKKSTSLDDLAELSVRLYYEFNLLEEAIIRAEVVGKLDDMQSRFGLAAPITFKQKRVEREYSDFDDVVPRVMHIDLTKSETHFKFNFLFHNAQQQKVIFPAPVRLPETEVEHELTKIRDLWYAVAMSPSYTNGLEGKPAEFDTHVFKLAQAGSRLWALMFKRDVGSSLFQVGEWLERHPLPSDALIQVSLDNKAADFIFPWSLLYDRKVPKEENKNSLDKQGFWGLRYCIEQQPPEVRRLPDRPIQADDPLRLRCMLWKSFPNANEEISFLEELASRSVGKVEINFPPIIDADECLKILRDCRENILYFYAHGHTEHCYFSPDMSLRLHEFLKKYEGLPEDSPLFDSLSEPEQPSYIKLTYGKLILDDLYKDVIRQFSSRPFVFLNMCESAQITPSLTKSFVHFFLNRGASAVLGTECPMTVEFAHPFAKEYLTGILAGEAAGPMLLKARRQFMGRLNPLGLAYSLYGPATTNFQPPRCPLPAPGAAKVSSSNTHTEA